MKLIRHLPKRLAEIKEIADIQNAVDPELDEIHRRVLRILANRNPLHADLEGVQTWEEWLEMHPGPEKSLQERQYDIVVKLCQRLPFTTNQLRRVLGGMLGYENYTLQIPDGRAHLDVTIDSSVSSAGSAVKDLLRRMVPAHVGWTFTKVHEERESNVRVVCAGRTETIVETRPGMTYTSTTRVKLNNAGRVEVTVDTNT